MTDPIARIRHKLIERIAQIVDDHRAINSGSGFACSCGAQERTDHSHHVADEIVRQLGFMPDTIDEAKNRIRCVSAVLDWELTQFEGAQ